MNCKAFVMFGTGFCADFVASTRHAVPARHFMRLCLHCPKG